MRLPRRRSHTLLERNQPLHPLRILFEHFAVRHLGHEKLRFAAFDDEAFPDLGDGEDPLGFGGGVDGLGAGGVYDDHCGLVWIWRRDGLRWSLLGTNLYCTQALSIDYPEVM